MNREALLARLRLHPAGQDREAAWIILDWVHGHHHPDLQMKAADRITRKRQVH
jgi:hypothetical protein